MNQNELIGKVQEMVSENNDQAASKAMVEAIIKNLASVIIHECSKEGDVTIPGVGKFRGIRKAARQTRNPKTGGKVDVAEKIVCKFSISSTAKRLVNVDS